MRHAPCKGSAATGAISQRLCLSKQRSRILDGWPAERPIDRETMERSKDAQPMFLLVLISLSTWAAATTIVVAACLGASHADGHRVRIRPTSDDAGAIFTLSAE